MQWTPWEMGRGRAELPGLSRRSGVQIVGATGLHRAGHHDRERPADVRDRLAGLFVHEPAAAPVRAGLSKVAGAFHHLDAHARRVMTAAAEAHHITDAPIGVHLEAGTAAPDVLDLLRGSLGVAPGRVILGHPLRFPDTGVHRLIAAAGAFLAFDGPSRAHHATDWRLLGAPAALADDNPARAFAARRPAP